MIRRMVSAVIDCWLVIIIGVSIMAGMCISRHVHRDAAAVAPGTPPAASQPSGEATVLPDARDAWKGARAHKRTDV